MTSRGLTVHSVTICFSSRNSTSRPSAFPTTSSRTFNWGMVVAFGRSIRVRRGTEMVLAGQAAHEGPIGGIAGAAGTGNGGTWGATGTGNGGNSVEGSITGG